MTDKQQPRLELKGFDDDGKVMFTDTYHGIVLAHRGSKTQAIFALLDAPDDMEFTVVENRPRTEEEW